MKNEIKSEKILVGKIFSEMWFRIPEYQRPYVWGNDQVSELLDDVCYAMLEKPDSEYFLGSFVFQSQKTRSGDGVEFSENDLLDGQQRMTTLFLLFAVLRDRLGNEKAIKSCQKRLFQEQDEYDNIPERLRIMFAIRNDAQEFIESLRLNNDRAGQEIDGWVSNDRSFLELLRTMMSTGYSFSFNDAGGAVAKYGLSEHSLKKLIGMDTPEIQGRIDAVISNSSYLAQQYPEIIKAVRELPEELPD